MSWDMECNSLTAEIQQHTLTAYRVFWALIQISLEKSFLKCVLKGISKTLTVQAHLILTRVLSSMK